MRPNRHPHLETYLETLRGSARLGGPLGTYAFLTLTTLTRPLELEAPATEFTDGLLAVQNVVGLPDVRTRTLPPSRSAAATVSRSGGLQAIMTAVTGGTEALPQALQRHLNDAEGLCGLECADQIWQVAVQALICAVPPAYTDAVLGYAGLLGRCRAVDPHALPGVGVVATTIDELVCAAGFKVEGNQAP